MKTNYVKAITGVVTYDGKPITTKDKFYKALVLQDEKSNETDVTIIGNDGEVHKISMYYTDGLVYKDMFL